MPKLTDEHRDLIAAKRAAGVSLEQIKQFLKADHGVSVSLAQISRVAKSHRSSLADATKSVVRSTIVETVQGSAQAIKERAARAWQIEEAAARLAIDDPASGIPLWAKAHAEACRSDELVLKAGGANQPDEPMVDGLVGLLGLALDEEDEAAREAAFAEDDDDADDDGDEGD